MRTRLAWRPPPPAGGAPLAQHIEDFMRVCSCAAFMQASAGLGCCLQAWWDGPATSLFMRLPCNRRSRKHPACGR